MKKVLIATTLMTSVAGAYAPIIAQADENNVQSELLNTEKANLMAKANDAINLRRTASWSGEKILVISKGQSMSVVSKGAEWTKVLFNGKEGFVPTEHITIQSQPTQGTATATDAINLRKTASWSGEKILVISKGQSVEIISEEGEWSKVSYSGKIGYAPASYLKKNNSEGTTPETPKPEVPETGVPEENFSAKGKVVKIASNDVLNVRKQPNGDAEKITTLKLNQTVAITKKVSNGWYKISANGTEGYVNGKYIQIIEEAPQTGEEYITTDRVNLRNTKSWSSSAVILTIEKNETLSVIEKDSDWAKVHYKGNTGFVPVDYIKSTEGNVTPPSDNKVGKIGTVNASSLNIRSGPGTSYSVISKVYSGDTVLIKEVSNNGWYKVESTSGIIGWCSDDYIVNIREGSLPSEGTNDEKINNVLKIARQQLGKPYVYGATGPDSFDCSGLSSYAYKNGASITLPRTSRDQATAGRHVAKSELKPGDLVFFNTSGSGISHLGIYIGDNEMIHAPRTGKNVEITKMNSSYWSSRYVTARRIIG